MKEEKKRQERSDGVGISRNTSIFYRDRFFLFPTRFVPSFRHRRLLAANKEARMLALEIPFLWETSEESEREREREEERSNRLSVCQAKTGAAKDSCQPLNYLGNSIERLGNWNRAKKFRDCEITWLLAPPTWRLILFVSLLSITVHVSRKEKGELVVPLEIIQFQFSRSFHCTVVLFENFSAFHPERYLGGIPPIVP